VTGRFISRDSVMGRPSDPTSLNDPGGYESIWEEAAGLLGSISRRLNPLLNPAASLEDAVGQFKQGMNVSVHLYAIGRLALNGFDNNVTAAQLNQEAQGDPLLAWGLTNAHELGYMQAANSVSSLSNFIPGYGEAKMLVEGVSGQDIFTGRKLGSLERVLSGAAGLHGVLGGGRGVAATEEGAGLKCSFSSDTLVATDAGEKAIGSLVIGDKVLAYDQQSGTTGNYAIQAVLVHDDPEIEYLRIEGEWLQTTPEHPFFSQEQGWVAAGELRPGQHIRKADGSYGQVQTVEVVQQQKQMYNLTVEQAHTFFVGKKQWLVHNECQRVLFGQRRIDANFSMKSEVPNVLSGRSIYEVAEDLRNGILTSDQIPIRAFKYKGQLVAENNRGLAALSLANLQPTNIITVAKPGTEIIARLKQRSLIGGYKLPSTYTVITPKNDLQNILDIIRLPK